MLTVEEAKAVVESIKFTGLSQLMKTRLETNPWGVGGLQVWIYIDMPDARTDKPEESGRIHIDNNLNFKNLDSDPDFDVQSLKNAIYNQVERFMIHELREGIRICHLPVVPAHGPNGEFLPKGRFMETPE